MSLDLCADTLREHDPDRFGICLLAPAEARAKLLTLYALNLELARAPLASNEPLIAEMRLQWWVERLEDRQDRLLVAVQAGQGGDSRLEDLTSGLEQAFTSLIERQDRLIALAAQPTAMPPEMAQALERITESQQRLALAAPQPAASGDGAAARALARLADGQARLVELAEARPGAAQDDPEARMRLRSIDVQLGRLVEEAASGRDGLIAELREDMAALTRAIRALEARDGA